MIGSTRALSVVFAVQSGGLAHESATGDFISGVISGVAGIGSIAAAFGTGGASTAVGAAVAAA